MKTESNRFFCFQTKLPIAIFKTFRYLRKLSKYYCTKSSLSVFDQSGNTPKSLLNHASPTKAILPTQHFSVCIFAMKRFVDTNRRTSSL